jgi:hypothetical protein
MDWRNTTNYRKWRDKRCVICGAIKRRHAHHIAHATYFPYLRYSESNGICLCGSCHLQFHCHFKRSYRTKCDSYDFHNFKCLVKYFRSFYEGSDEIRHRLVEKLLGQSLMVLLSILFNDTLPL